MADTLAIVSKKVFESSWPDAKIGDVVDIGTYRSSNKALDSLGEGGSLFLVTVRPGDELWLIGTLVNPARAADGWTASPNKVEVRSITHLISELKFTTGAGISAKPGRLGMSLQSARKLTADDVVLLKPVGEVRSNSVAPVKPPDVKIVKAPVSVPRAVAPRAETQETATPGLHRSDIEAVIAGRMEQAIGGVQNLSAIADASVVEPLLTWINMAKWRSSEATTFWVHTYFLLMRFCNASHLPALRHRPEHEDYSQMHLWIRRNRLLVERVVELREGAEHVGPRDDMRLPRGKAKVLRYISERLGDPTWQPCDELVAFVQAPKFKLDGEEGLSIYAALLLHGEPAKLRELLALATTSPIVAQILAAHGVQAPDGKLGEALLQAVLADPADDDARLVYADWLMEQDNPRGAFINAQLRGENPELDLKIAVQWAGELGPVMRWRAAFANDRPEHVPRYRRGFVTGCNAGTLDGSSASSPDWATIEVLDVDGTLDRIAEYNLPSVRVLGGIGADQLCHVLASPLAEHLEVICLHNLEDAWDLLSEFPRLRFVGGGADAQYPRELAHVEWLETTSVLNYFDFFMAKLHGDSMPEKWMRPRLYKPSV